MCVCVPVYLCDISFVLSPLHTPEFLKAQIHSLSDSMPYCSSLIKIQVFIDQDLYFVLMPVTLKHESFVLAKIKIIFKEVFA